MIPDFFWILLSNIELSSLNYPLYFIFSFSMLGRWLFFKNRYSPGGWPFTVGVRAPFDAPFCVCTYCMRRVRVDCGGERIQPARSLVRSGDTKSSHGI